MIGNDSWISFRLWDSTVALGGLPTWLRCFPKNRRTFQSDHVTITTFVSRPNSSPPERLQCRQHVPIKAHQAPDTLVPAQQLGCGLPRASSSVTWGGTGRIAWISGARGTWKKKGGEGGSKKTEEKREHVRLQRKHLVVNYTELQKKWR